MTRDLLVEGLTALAEEEYHEAVNLFTTDYTSALIDANKAIELDPANAKAYLRKGEALYNQEEYESARDAFSAGGTRKGANGDKLKAWVEKCDARIREEGGDVAVPEIVTVPAASLPAAHAASEAALRRVQPGETKDVDMNAPVAASLQVEKPQKYRYQHFQAMDFVCVQIFAKGMTKERVAVAVEEQQLWVEVKGADAHEVEYVLDVPLYEKVVVESSSHTLLSTQIEIKLKKANPAITWPSLERSAAAPGPARTDAAAAAADAARTKEYPSSSRRHHKDWDKLEQEAKEEEKNEKLEGDQALHKLFRDIYGNADEDTRRAMIKSYQESNGTVLSTNWSEVGKKTVDCTPPDGMEVRRYEV